MQYVLLDKPLPLPPYLFISLVSFSLPSIDCTYQFIHQSMSAGALFAGNQLEPKLDGNIVEVSSSQSFVLP